METPFRTFASFAAAIVLFAAGAARVSAESSTLPSPQPALPVASAVPRPGATAICPDTPLRLTFDRVPTLGRIGRIRIVDTATGKDAEVIDVSIRAVTRAGATTGAGSGKEEVVDFGTAVATQSIGGEANYRYYPVIISGREATIYPRNGALAYGRTYRVLIESGVFADNAKAYAGLTEPQAWTFTTKPAGPAKGATKLTVAADGTGDFCTVQGALDFIPDGNTTPTTILVRKGTYTELVFLTNKHAITLRGEDRQQTVIAYATNDRFNPSSGNPFGTPRPDPSAARHVYHRGVFLAHRVNDLALTNLTIRNTTPQGGSQAEAIILNGTQTARAILKDLDLYSYQDTLQINGQAFVSGCHIEGDVDFMWGTGPCYFVDCTCRSLRSGAYYTQIRNSADNHGFVYVRCTFDGTQGVMGNYLSRIGTGRFPHSEVVLLDCVLTPAVGPVGWQLSGGREGNDRDPAQIHFWEFNSHTPAGEPIDASLRMPGSRQLSASVDAAVIAQYRQPGFVLGHDWNPLTAPVIVEPAKAPADTAVDSLIAVHPASRLVLLGTRTTLRVTLKSDAEPVSMQWLKNGQRIPGANSPTLRVGPMRFEDAGSYVLAIRTARGKVTSQPARLTAVAPQATPAPDLPRIPEAIFNVMDYGARGDGRTNDTGAIQLAIESAVAAGGGTVVLPASPQPYLSGPLTIGSYVALEVAAGATLRMLPYSADGKPGTYPLRGPSYPNFISANGVHDIALLGAGTIDGDGQAWWDAFRANRAMPHRPYLVRLASCERVFIAGLTFTRSPMFHVAANANHLTIFGIRIDTPEAPNTDGIDPSGSHHLIQNCYVSCGDDNVVMKPGNAYCSDITVADCDFRLGHGMSVGGQSNQGLDGMVVKNCAFTGTVSGLRLKADATQGGEVRNLTYTNLTMDHVRYPIVFYSYYNRVGNPGSTSGSNQTTPEKVRAWNAKPPNSLEASTLPSWKNITLANVAATGAQGANIIWGLPKTGCFIENVTLRNVRILGGRGLGLYNAADVKLDATTDVGPISTVNALAVRSPNGQQTAVGGTATFTAEVLGPGASGDAHVTCQWLHNGTKVTDGTRPDGTVVSGATTETLTLTHVTQAAAGKYALTATARLDAYDTASGTLAPASVPVTTTSTPVTLVIEGTKSP